MPDIDIDIVRDHLPDAQQLAEQLLNSTWKLKSDRNLYVANVKPLITDAGGTPDSLIVTDGMRRPPKFPITVGELELLYDAAKAFTDALAAPGVMAALNKLQAR